MRHPKDKEQELTVAEQWFEILGQANRGTPIQKELQTVSRKLDSPEKRLQWAVQFAQRDLKEMTDPDFINIILEAGVFLDPELVEVKTITFNKTSFPVLGELDNMQQEFLKLLKAATSGIPYTFPMTKLSMSVSSHGIRYDIPRDVLDGKKLADARLQQAVWTLGHLAAQMWNYIGFCDRKRFGCGKFFLRDRTNQEFCTHSCASRSTTYRRRGKEPAA